MHPRLWEKSISNAIRKMTNIMRLFQRALSSLHYRLFFLRSIAQFFTQIYMNCFVSLQVEQTNSGKFMDNCWILNIISSYGWYEKKLRRSHNYQPVFIWLCSLGLIKITKIYVSKPNFFYLLINLLLIGSEYLTKNLESNHRGSSLGTILGI